MSSALLRLLACPQCGASLEAHEKEVLRCSGCEARHAVLRGMPSLVPRTTDRDDDEWQGQQERGRERYESSDSDGKAYFDSVAREFGAFCRASGLVLDVGCGLDPAPAYIQPSGDSTYVGLDPLLPERAPPRPFVQGVAERLPFLDATFDWVLSATSFDHFPEPEQALAEIRRVLKPEGRFGVWLAVVDPDYLQRMHAERFRLPSPLEDANRAALLALVRARSTGLIASLVWRHAVANRVGQIRAAILRRLREQELLDAAFAERAAYHHRFYRAEEFQQLTERAGFEILTQHRVEDDAHGHSLFVVAARGSG